MVLLSCTVANSYTENWTRKAGTTLSPVALIPFGLQPQTVLFQCARLLFERESMFNGSDGLVSLPVLSVT